MTIKELHGNHYRDAYGKRAPISAASSVNEAAVLSVLATALPSSLLAEALTDSAAVSEEIASEFAAGITPSWFAALPTPIQTYLLGPEDASSSSNDVQSSSSNDVPTSSSSDDQSLVQQSSVVQRTSNSDTSLKPQTSLSLAGPTSSPLFPDPTSATATPTGPNDNADSFPTGAVAGGVVGGVAGLALIGCGAFLLLRRRKRNQRIEPMREVSVHPSITSSGYRDF